MPPRARPGLVFTIVCDRGFALGLQTHVDKSLGALVWIAEGFWDDEPTTEDVASAQWRWCVFFPLGAALRRRIVFALGHTDIPEVLVPFPMMRAGSKQQGWFVVRGGDVDAAQRSFRVDDAVLPPRIIVNDTALKEMLVTGWRPVDMW